MENHLQQELEDLKMAVLNMAARTHRTLEKAVASLFERNSDLAGEVIKEEPDINRLEIDMDRTCLRLLALDQPLAGDLRFIIGCMRITTDVERIADEAVNVAEASLFLVGRPALPHNHALKLLGETAMEMYSAAVSAFIRLDAGKAEEVCRMDDRADEFNVQALKALIDYMTRESPAVERSVRTIIASRSLERVADLATNIAESVIFIAKGINVKHQLKNDAARQQSML